MSGLALTSQATLVPGEVRGSGSESAYRGLTVGPPEPHLIRRDFVPGWGELGRGSRIFSAVHLTDLHIADPQSPARLEFAARVNGGYRFRPHEMLTSHATAAMVSAIAGLDIDFCVSTGDVADNAQANEVRAFLDLMDGGDVSVVAPRGQYFGVQHVDWNDEWYWRPDQGVDRYKQLWGYPTLPGFLDGASKPIRSNGLSQPWISGAGNHDLLFGGEALPTPELNTHARGSRKPYRLPDELLGRDFTMLEFQELLLQDPELVMSGPTHSIDADPSRKLLTLPDFIALHGGRLGGVQGRGFTDPHRGYYAYDPMPGVRVLMLDTNHRFGDPNGSVSREQMEWLDTELRRATGPDEPLIVLASHHASTSINNIHGLSAADRLETAYAQEVVELAVKCPNVILWLNGHHHYNRVTAHYGSGGGFYEVTTPAIADWPSQARLLEVERMRDGSVCVTSTAVNHSGPATPTGDLSDPLSLASLHRELAANEHWRGARPGLSGVRQDRNVTMIVPAP